MKCRRGICLSVLIVSILLAPWATGSAHSSSVVAQFDLHQKIHFENFREIGITPFLRMGNVFFAEVDQFQLLTARQADIPYAVVDDRPFDGHYYVGTIESLPSRRMPVAELERLTEVAEHALYKSAQPIDPREYRQVGFEPFEIKRREIPLVYFPTGHVSPNPKASAADPILDGLLATIDQDSIYTYNRRLELFQTRLSLSDSSIMARNWIKEKFESFGYTDVTYDQFWIDDNRLGAAGYTWNIVCVKPGTADPDKVIVIGGHWDSIVYGGNDPYIFAPGSDDDGSGTTATLEIARVLAGTPTKKTIIFVAFGAEENGLNGSWHYAGNAYYSGMDIEMMLNMDMIGYTEDSYPNVNCSYMNGVRTYANLTAQLGEQYTWLYPSVFSASSGSDHWPFGQYGFNVSYLSEGDFNYPGWHTDLDLTSQMDFPYLTEVIKMGLAAIYTVANNPSVINNAVALDVGDGQSLQVEWTALGAPDITGYRVYWGIESDNYPDSVFVPGGSSSQTILNGLVENQQYYLTVVALDTEGRESYIRPEFTATPRVIPLAPAGVSVDPGDWQIELAWQPNQELDFNYYRIYRGTTPGSYSLLQDNWTATDYIDTDVNAGIMYVYVITALDDDLNQSVYSAEVTAAAATFDQGILIIDTTPEGTYDPTAQQKEDFFNTIFGGMVTAYYFYDPVSENLNKSIIGQYEAVFWFDDANAAGYWEEEDIDILRWYLSHNTNVLLAGWRVTFEFSGLGAPKTLTSGNLLYDFLGIYSTDEVTDVDFKGGIGQAGFPSAALDPNKVYYFWNGKMGWIGVLPGILGGTEEIYTFDSHSGEHAGKRVGVRRDNGTSKFIYLSMPFYYLQDTEAQAVISEAADWFGIENTCDCSEFCDVNRDGAINPLDVVYIVNYVYKDLAPPLPLIFCFQGTQALNGDWNCDGAVNPVDVVYFVNKVYKDADPPPCNPCACDPYPGNCP